MNDESVYESRGLLSFPGNSVQTHPAVGIPFHPYLRAGMHSFCAAGCNRPLADRCPGCPLTAAEVEQARALLADSPDCPTCGQPVTKRQKRRAKENP